MHSKKVMYRYDMSLMLNQEYHIKTHSIPTMAFIYCKRSNISG